MVFATDLMKVGASGGVLPPLISRFGYMMQKVKLENFEIVLNHTGTGMACIIDKYKTK